MLCSLDTKLAGGSVTHQALLYGSEEEFLAGTVPFVRDGLVRGDPIRVATTDRNAGWLRAALGADAQRVEFCASSQCYRHPAQALAAAHHIARTAGTDGHRLRIIGEPLWTARSAPERKEWNRYESLVNSVLAEAGVALLCTYDIHVVDQDVMTQVARTHPELVVDGEPRPSPGYADPAVINSECNSAPLAELPPPSLWLRFHGVDQLATLRDFVSSHASGTGADTRSVGPFVQAVDEIATNAIRHGGGSGVLQVWTSPRTILCQISDTGPGLRDPLAGQLPLAPGHAGGCGLWLARQFSDLLELHSDPAGTTVRLHLMLH
ncbi:MAG: anti-sigma factor RsbA family regulatory protein [Pseudonocardiaceae bacterium]